MQENAWVGLRPGRAPLRLDSESVQRSRGGRAVSSRSEQPLHIVHCYGHGGSGVTLGMGCAQDVVVNHLGPLLNLQAAGSAQSTPQDGRKLSSWFAIRSRL